MPGVVRVGDSLSTGHICTAVTTLGGAAQSTVSANGILAAVVGAPTVACLLYTSPSPRDRQKSRMPSSA